MNFFSGTIRISWRVVKELIWIGSMIVVGVFSGGFLIYLWNTPDAADLTRHPLTQTSIIYDRTGTQILYQIHGEENRVILPHEAIPDTIRVAVIAAEDATFYSHPGIDWQSILRAFLANTESGTLKEGGSTITQQLVRNILLDRQKTFQRKMKEAVLAIKIERHYTKDEILDLYLNTVPFGANAYGVETAAQTHFDKPAKDLTLDEATMLAALPKAPTYFSPYGNHKDELRNRQRWVLDRIESLNLAPATDIAEAHRGDPILRVAPYKNAIQAPHFVFSVLEELEREYGRNALEHNGWNIYTTLDLDLQHLAEQSVQEGVARNASRNAENAALVALDPNTGEVLALVGSRNFFDTAIDGEVNVAERPRQPGSSFKPFAYAKAFEKGFQPETLLYDVPTDFGPDGSGKNYMPHNYDGRSHGLLPMRRTLAGSLNIPAVQTLYLAGVQNTIDLAHRLGITTLNEPDRYGLALVLGGGEVKLLDMTAAFSVFATEGIRHPETKILSITDSHGQTVAGPANIPARVLDTQIARKIDSILSDNDARSFIFGSHSPLILSDRPVAAKTGTTQEFRDAWTIGFTPAANENSASIPALAVGVWAGNNDNRPMRFGSDGVFVAAPIWHDFIQKALALKHIAPASFTPYIPVTSDKPMLTGKTEADAGLVHYYRRNSGKEISFEKFSKADPSRVEARVDSGGTHTILYYVNKNAPLGPTPPDMNDPMLPRWEASLGHAQPNDLTPIDSTNTSS